MTHDEFRAIRRDMKISEKALADFMGVSRKTIQVWERGPNPVPGPAEKLLVLLLEKILTTDALTDYPKFLLAERPLASDGAMWVYHNHRPRFVCKANLPGESFVLPPDEQIIGPFKTPSGYTLGDFVFFDQPNPDVIPDLVDKIDEVIALDEAHAEAVLSEIIEEEEEEKCGPTN